MLKGFTAPRSPLGAAALVPSPPWHFAGDFLAVEFWNDPDVSVHVLPTGVELDKKCPGHSVALFTDYQFTAQNDEYLDPARYQCHGFSVLLNAIWNGTRIAWRPYCYVDNDAALMRGWIQVILENSVLYTRPVLLPLRARLRRHSRTIAGSPPACPLMAGCWCKLASPYAKKQSGLLACSIAALWDGDTFRGFQQACTTSQPWMNSFDASRTTS